MGPGSFDATEALAAEKRVKGSRKRKKLALICGDSALISRFARTNDNPSTGSGQTGRGVISHQAAGAELDEALLFHPSHRPAAADSVRVNVRREGNHLSLRYRVGDADAVRLIDHAAVRTDDLWRHTCFEAFVAGSGSSYFEFNFAPSGAWAAYAFDDYRSGMREAEAAPAVTWRNGVLSAAVEIPIAGDWRLNLSAVIEENDGTRSYWALAHPDGPPDFHDPACFVLSLPAVG